MTSLQLPKGREQRLSFFLFFNSLNKFILKISTQAINSIRNNVHSPESPCSISEDEKMRVEILFPKQSIYVRLYFNKSINTFFF